MRGFTFHTKIIQGNNAIIVDHHVCGGINLVGLHEAGLAPSSSTESKFHFYRERQRPSIRMTGPGQVRSGHSNNMWLPLFLLLMAAAPVRPKDLHSMIYDTYPATSPPFRLLSGNGQIGYGSPEAGLVAPLFDGTVAIELQRLLSHPAVDDKPAVVIAPGLLTPSIMKQLRSVAAAVILPSRKTADDEEQGGYPPEGFSPQEADPNRRRQTDQKKRLYTDGLAELKPLCVCLGGARRQTRRTRTNGTRTAPGWHGRT